MSRLFVARALSMSARLKSYFIRSGFSPYATTTCKFSQGAVIVPDESFHCESPKALYAERGLRFKLSTKLNILHT